MLKLQPFQMYYTILYVCGLNPLILFADVRESQSKVIVYLPRFLTIIVNAYLVCNTALGLQYTKSFFFFGHLSFACDVCLNFIVIFENLSNTHALHKVLHAISFTVNSLERNLGVNFPFNAIKMSIVRKLLLKILFLLFELISKLMIDPGTRFILERRIYYDICYMFTNLNLFHLIFYIEFIKYSIATLNEAIVQQIKQENVHWRYEYTKQCLHILRQIKLIHFELWRISHGLNSLFGWFLIVLTTALITGSIFDAYYIFVYGSFASCNQVCFWRKYCNSSLLYFFFKL